MTRRGNYTDEQRRLILKFAKQDGLTALDVQKKFGVKPMTYYTWRKEESLRKPAAIAPDIQPRGRKSETAAGWCSFYTTKAHHLDASNGVSACGRQILNGRPLQFDRFEPLGSKRCTRCVEVLQGTRQPATVILREPRSRASWSTWSDIPPELEAKARELRPAVGPFGLALAIGLVRAMRAAGLKPLRQQRLPLDAPRRAPAPVGHSRRRESPTPAGSAAVGHSPFSWANKEGWARCRVAHSLHYWRHGRTLCGAYIWQDRWGAPALDKEISELLRTHGSCRRCVKRSSSAMRPLWRDRRAGGAA